MCALPCATSSSISSSTCECVLMRVNALRSLLAVVWGRWWYKPKKNVATPMSGYLTTTTTTTNTNNNNMASFPSPETPPTAAAAYHARCARTEAGVNGARAPVADNGARSREEPVVGALAVEEDHLATRFKFISGRKGGVHV